MNNLEGVPAEVHLTLEVTRAATGLTETVHMVGHAMLPVAPTQEPEENKIVSDTL